MAGNADDGPAAAFGRRVRGLRLELGLSQTGFGQLLGVAQPTVARWENGRHMPDDATILQLSRIAKASPATLRYGETQPVLHRAAGDEVLISGELGPGWRLAWRRGEARQGPAAVPEGGSQLRAVRVRGDALIPLRDGWLLLYAGDSEPRQALGKFSVVQPADADHALVGEVRRGSRRRRFDLQPWSGEPMRDLALAWAAPVLEIRPRYRR